MGIFHSNPVQYLPDCSLVSIYGDLEFYSTIVYIVVIEDFLIVEHPVIYVRSAYFQYFRSILIDY